MEEEKLACYVYACPHYMECALSCGKGCCIDEPDEDTRELKAADCNEENGYKYFKRVGK